MKPTHKDITSIKKIYKELFKYMDDPRMQSLVESNKRDIKYNLNFYGYPTPKSFAKENSFCILCGSSLNEDNICTGCQKEYGW